MAVDRKRDLAGKARRRAADLSIVTRPGRNVSFAIHRTGKHKTVVIVGVFANQIDSAGSRKHAFHRSARDDPAARSAAAVCSGSVSLMNEPAPDSQPARNLSFVAVRWTG